MSLLSERQREDLYVVLKIYWASAVVTTEHRHRAILDYLFANNFTDSFYSFKADTGIDYSPDPASQSRAILEKKWTTVIRLQKKASFLSFFLSFFLLENQLPDP